MTVLSNPIKALVGKVYCKQIIFRTNSAMKSSCSHLCRLHLRGLNDWWLCWLDHSLNLELTPGQLDNSHRRTTQWHLEKLEGRKRYISLCVYIKLNLLNFTWISFFWNTLKESSTQIPYIIYGAPLKVIRKNRDCFTTKTSCMTVIMWNY